MNTTLRRSFSALLAATLFLATCVVLAAPADEANRWDEARTTVVKTADLDLATASGQAQLQSRVAGAVDRVCALPNAEQLAQRARVAACRAEARDRADASVARLIEAARSVARRGS